MGQIRLIKHESVPQTGSYEVRFPDGRPSVYHYFDDDPGRRSITGTVTGEALQAAKTLAQPATSFSPPQKKDPVHPGLFLYQ